MKKLLLCVFLFIANTTLTAQIVTETVNFDNYVSPTNNDLENRFSNSSSTSLIQVQTNGITGGSLNTPDSLNWGNDNAVYCSKFQGSIGSSYTASICFKYNTTTISSGGFDRAAAIWMNPSADWNHYIITTVEKNQRLGILSYAWNNNYNTILNLIHDHWYRLTINASFIGGSNNDQIDLLAEVYDLGITGTNNPTLVNSSSGMIFDSLLVADDAISIGINGAQFGGATFLDDFYYQGVKSADSCSITTEIQTHVRNENLVIYPNPVDGSLRSFKIDISSNPENLDLEIIDLFGKSIFRKSKVRQNSNFTIPEYISKGMYTLRVNSKNVRYTARLLIQ